MDIAPGWDRVLAGQFYLMMLSLVNCPY